MWPGCLHATWPCSLGCAACFNSFEINIGKICIFQNQHFHWFLAGSGAKSSAGLRLGCRALLPQARDPRCASCLRVRNATECVSLLALPDGAATAPARHDEHGRRPFETQARQRSGGDAAEARPHRRVDAGRGREQWPNGTSPLRVLLLRHEGRGGGAGYGACATQCEPARAVGMAHRARAAQTSAYILKYQNKALVTRMFEFKRQISRLEERTKWLDDELRRSTREASCVHLSWVQVRAVRRCACAC